MKNCFAILCITLALWGCEDVVQVDLPTETPKLVIDATGIQFENKKRGILTLKLSTTAPFFADKIPLVSGAKAEVNVNGKTYTLDENEKSKGFYIAQIPMIYDQEYTLTITYKGETYQGSTQLYPTVPIDFVTQSSNAIDPDETSINAYFTDPPGKENFYYFSFITGDIKVQDNTDDQLIDGNQVSTFYADKFKVGDSIKIVINGISKRCNTYFSILSAQSGSSSNPFATAPSTIRGNMVNITNRSNFPLGYFRISQQYQHLYIVQEKSE